jgi:pimeloyl-ACP methyl ester carboxylesterase
MSLLIFSHANGFPASTYRKLFGLLAPPYRIAAVEMYGHNPRYPVTDNWPHLVDELLALIEREAVNEQALLVGHSLGGFLSLMAAHKLPQRVRGVILLDSPIVAGWRARGLRLAKRLGIEERLSPARFAKQRRTHWPSVDDALRHFRSKPLFAHWDAQMLRDYVEHGTVQDGDARKLAFSREVEYWIFRHFPDHLPRFVRRPFPVPVAFVGGTHSAEVRMVGTRDTLRVTEGRMRWIEGGHLFPMEKPEETAQAIREIDAQWMSGPAPRRSTPAHKPERR